MMATHSPYIVNYLNVLLRRYNRNNNVRGSSVASDDLSVYRVFEGRIQNLVGQDENGHIAVDTSDLSEVMESIYNEYVSLR